MDTWIPDLIVRLGYAGVALLMFLETVFPPIPSEVIMPLAGMQAARGQLSLVGTIVAGTAGAMLGNILWYLAARALGVERFRGFVERHGRRLTLSWSEVERARRGFARGGAPFVAIGRLIPAVRSVVSIPAGLLAMPFGRFLFWSGVGTLAWTALLTVAGTLLGANYEAVNRFVGPVSTGIIVVIAVAYVWRVATWRR